LIFILILKEMMGVCMDEDITKFFFKKKREKVEKKLRE
jgi:hypothetical protein